MRNLQHFIIIITAMLIGLSAAAQVKDISLSAGVNVPIYKDLESDAVINVSYGQFFRNGLGFRAGLQWNPSVVNVSNAFGTPVAFAYRTKTRTSRERICAGVEGSADVISQGAVYDNECGTTGNVVSAFFMNLFSNMEFFVGFTPGYIQGSSSQEHEAVWGASWQYWEKSWTEKKSAFSFMLDAGMTLNYSIWRFDIKLTPAFHYGLTGNYLYHVSTGEKDAGITTTDTIPIRWFYTFTGGLAFRF